MKLMDEYYEHILDKVDHGEAKNKAFKILSDVKNRRGWRQEWDNFDDDVREEILETWIKILES